VHPKSLNESDPAGADHLPANFRRSFELGARVIGSLGDGADLEQEIAEKRRALREVLDPHDAVHLMGQLCMAESFIDPDTYSESEHPGSAYVIEVVAAELLRRDDRAGSRDASAIDANVLGPIRDLAAEATMLESFRRQVTAGFWSGPEGAARGRAAAHHLYLRNPGWWWQEHETLRGLFGETRFADRLREQLGFDCEGAIAISDAVPGLIRDRMINRMESARDDPGKFEPGNPAFHWAESVFDDKWNSDPTNAARFIPIVWAMNTLGEACLLSPTEVAAAADVSGDVSAAYLERMSLPFGRDEEEWFTLAEEVRWHPYVKVTDEAYFLTSPGADLWALRPAFEDVLKNGAAYAKHRGRWLERQAAETLRPVLEPDEMHHSVHFHDAERQGEIDVLMRCGSTAVVVEAKSATLRPGARRGGEALISHLRENLTKAAAQGEQAKEVLLESRPLTGPSGEEVKLAERVTEVQTIVVTLDDLSAVAPVLWELEGTRTMPEGVTAPWVVNLNELTQVAATSRWPVQLIHFLRRRSRLNELGRFVASDELDWWMHYLNFGLYFEKETGEERIRYTSLTDPLDHWMLYEKGVRTEPAPKPEMKIPEGSTRFLDLLCSERPPGWVQAGCALLDADSDSQRELWKGMKKLRKLARKRKRVQRVALTFKEPAPLLLCGIAGPEAPGEALLESLKIQVAERFDELGAQRTLAIGSSVSSKRAYDVLVVIDRPET
jgi:Holliday junction resolvase-like predicted endonuclease